MPAANYPHLLRRGVVYGLLFLCLLIYLLPIYMILVTALKSPDAVNLNTAWDLPKSIYWQSFEEVYNEFGNRIRNSLILVTLATVFSALMGSLNGYVLSKWRIPGEKILFPLMLFGMFIPYQAILIPLFDFLRRVDLYGGLPGLILIHVVYGLPITTLIFRNFYVEIPDEMLEAGMMDGANFFDLYARIVFPLSIPGFVVVIIWQVTQIWNEFLFAVMLTSGTKAEPITVGLAQLAGGEAVKWNQTMAGALVAALPPLLVYIFAGRYFIRGLLAGSVKG
ncbi:MAG: carbohydrate ABC transporter permease [Anaerolineae bacterium]|nr:carbohydrate ABC transporter permease [Anaerolineae bacterium]